MSSTRPAVFAVIGCPIRHSRSPVLHTAGFRAAGLTHDYVALEVQPDALADAMRGVLALGLAGVNVTVPHKEQVLSHVHALAPAAERIGAVNTLVIEDGRLIGHNTDRDGFLDALAELGVTEVEHAVVLGGGGAARAVCDALAYGVGVTRLVWVSRSPDRLSSAGPLHPCIEAVPWEALPEVRGTKLLVNTTPVGMPGGPTSFPVPIPYEALAGAAVVDLVYGNMRNGQAHGWLGEAQQAGARVQDGLPLLLWQGVRAQALWLGQPRPAVVVEAMRAALTGG